MTTTRTPNRTDRAVASCQRMVKTLSERTGIEFTFGYIGNTYGIEGTVAFRDDRRWFAFAAHPGRIGTDHDRLGGYRTSDLSGMVAELHGALSLSYIQAKAR